MAQLGARANGIQEVVGSITSSAMPHIVNQVFTAGMTLVPFQGLRVYYLSLFQEANMNSGRFSGC